MVTNEARILNQTIKDSEEYNRYQQAMHKVKENQELYQAMNIFRRRNYELQSYDDGVNRYQEIHNLALEYEKVLRNPLVNEFLIAEQMISRKLEEVYEAIVEDLEFDYSYME
ncbi:MAG: YlbF family regulator [Lachnospiraceae bacterium]|nr:YlbF family regulator [Lachnospiraceae bacterium]